MADVPPDSLSILGIKISHLVAGAAGGLVRALSRPGESWFRRIGTALVGSLTASYGTPVATPIIWTYTAGYDVTVTSLEGLVGFVLGVTGMSLCEGVIRWVRRWRENPTLPPLPPLPPRR